MASQPLHAGEVLGMAQSQSHANYPKDVPHGMLD